jgi:hypothetical protein
MHSPTPWRLLRVTPAAASLTPSHPTTPHPSPHPTPQVRSIHDNIQAKLNEAFDGAKDYQPKVRPGPGLRPDWPGIGLDWISLWALSPLGACSQACPSRDDLAPA